MGTLQKDIISLQSIGSNNHYRVKRNVLDTGLRTKKNIRKVKSKSESTKDKNHPETETPALYIPRKTKSGITPSPLIGDVQDRGYHHPHFILTLSLSYDVFWVEFSGLRHTPKKCECCLWMCGCSKLGIASKLFVTVRWCLGVVFVIFLGFVQFFPKIRGISALGDIPLFLPHFAKKLFDAAQCTGNFPASSCYVTSSGNASCNALPHSTV